MKIKTKGLFVTFLVLGMILAAITGCRDCGEKPPPREEKPVIILTDSSGQKAEAFAVMNSVFGSFSGLLTDTQYTIEILRSDEKVISYCSHTSDKRGIIPTVALWWEIGVEYREKSRVGKFNPDPVFKYNYHCVLKREKEIVTKIPVRILPLEKTGPIIYSSNENGDPLNGFAFQKEDVYITGKNLPPGSKLHIHLVRDQHLWETGERLTPVFEEAQVMELKESQGDFTVRAAPAGNLRMGSYDFIVEYETIDGVFDRRDLIDSIYSVGFTIYEPLPWPPPPLPPHIEAQLACQAPPQDPVTGTVIGAPGPIYKDHFGANEEVWVAVNPLTGGHDYSFQNARLYVVYDKTAAGWVDGTALSDVSGGYEIVTIQPGCANVNYTRVWSSPAVRDAGYDVVVDFAPFGVYNRGQDIVDSLDAKGFVVPTLWVCLESVTFNHNTASSTSDALNIRKNYTRDVHVPEWEKAKQSYPAAYIKNKTITVKAVFSAAPGVTGAKIRAAKMYGNLGDISQKTVTFSGGTSGSVSFNVSANTPGTIQYFSQRWRWYCADVNTTGSAEVHLADSKNTIYIVLAQPQSPWTTSGQTEPWTDALTWSCYWANGETTPEGAAEKITKKLFKNVGGLYDTTWGAPSYGSFNLTAFLNNIPNIGVVNCYDMGKSLVTFSNVVGCGLSYRYSSPFGYLNCIYAIGRGWANNPFYNNPSYNSNPIVPEDWSSANGRSGFGNHAFGSIADNIFDACLTVDTDGNPDFGPPFTETWMINRPWNDYKTKVVDNNPATGTGYPSAPSFTVY